MGFVIKKEKAITHLREPHGERREHQRRLHKKGHFLIKDMRRCAPSGYRQHLLLFVCVCLYVCCVLFFRCTYTHTHTIIARAKWSAAAAFIIHRRPERARKDDCVEQRARKCHFVAVVHLTAQLVCLLLHSTPSTTAGVNGELGWDSFLFVFGTALDVFSTAAQHRIREKESGT